MSEVACKVASLYKPMYCDTYSINGELIHIPHWCIENVVLLKKLIREKRLPNGYIDWRAISEYFPRCTIMDLKREAAKRHYI